MNLCDQDTPEIAPPTVQLYLDPDETDQGLMLWLFWLYI